ncbi:MAG: hypothetical protein WC622_02635 [Pedobacter sp.]
MKIFKKLKDAERQGKLSVRMAAYLEQCQRKVADWLNNKATGLSKHDLTFGLVIFCSAFGGYMLWLLITSLGIFK